MVEVAKPDYLSLVNKVDQDLISLNSLPQSLQLKLNPKKQFIHLNRQKMIMLLQGLVFLIQNR